MSRHTLPEWLPPPMPSAPGRDLLAAFVKREVKNLTRFCLRAGVDPALIRHVLAGRRGRRMSADMAVRIEDATHGLVPVRAWCERDDLVAAPKRTRAA